MQIDYLGTEAVIKFIEASRLSKFRIERANASGSYIPVFEYLESNNNGDAIKEFKRAAEFINPNVVYKLTMFDFAEEVTDENGKTTTKTKKGKSGKQQGLFSLNSSANIAADSGQQLHKNNAAFDIAALKAELINEISKKHEENEILTEIKALKLKFAELDNEEEEEEEAGTIAGIRPEQIAQITGLINLFKAGSVPATINGEIDETTASKTENINRAIKILYKHDKELDKDLLKLADMAETKNETFKMLISSLRTM